MRKKRGGGLKEKKGKGREEWGKQVWFNESVRIGKRCGRIVSSGRQDFQNKKDLEEKPASEEASLSLAADLRQIRLILGAEWESAVEVEVNELENWRKNEGYESNILPFV